MARGKKKGNVSAKDYTLELLIKAAHQQFGETSVFIPNGRPLNLPTFSSGSVKLDDALGGGYASGRIVEIVAGASAGKTTLTLHAIAEFQRCSRTEGHPLFGKKAVFIDSEHALDLKYAESLGVDTEDIILTQPSYGEAAFNIAEMFIESGHVGLIVFDSVATMVPKKEMEGETGESFVGLQARMMSQGLRKITGKAHRANCTCIFINQWRQKIGVMFGDQLRVAA